MALVGAAPWYFAGAPWLAQYWMVWAAVILSALMACEILRRLWLRQEMGKVAIPGLALVVLGIAMYSWVQTIPYFTIDSPGAWAPSTIKIQRWFLGTPDMKLDSQFNAVVNTARTRLDENPAETWFDDARLALSVEPLHTRAGIGGLATAALMSWIGATAFQTRRSQ